MSSSLQNATPSYTITVSVQNRNERLDRFLGTALRETDLSRERIKRIIKEGGCQIDGKPCTSPNTRLSSGQTIVLTVENMPTSVTPEEGDIHCLYRDEHLLVLNKPAGLTVHPCPSCPEGTLVHRLVYHYAELRAQEGLRPGIVHRIDKDTSGLLLVALNERTRLALSESFAERTIHKEYLAIVHGVPPQQGEIDAPIGRHPSIKVRMAVTPNGKPARSAWRVLYADPAQQFSLVAVRIYSGRTHQIRVHMAHKGFPLWGDAVYGSATPPHLAEQGLALRQMLHAWHLSFEHPITKEKKDFRCSPPDDFMHLLLGLSQKTQRVILTGSPGCGKSTVLKALANKGFPTWSADDVVARLYARGNDGWHALRSRYGYRFFNEDDGEINRRALLLAMQEEPNLRRDIESIIHPLVRHDMERFFAEQHARGASAAFAEVPLFFEAGWRAGDGSCDIIAGIACSEKERLRRLTTIRGWTPEVIASMTAWQWADHDKMRACDVLIHNDASEDALPEKIEHFCSWLEKHINQQKQKRKKHFQTLLEGVSS